MFEELDILLAIAFLPHVKDIHLPVLDSMRRPVMNVVINISGVEFRVVQHRLSEIMILQIPGVLYLQSLVIQKNVLAFGKGATASVVRVWGRQASSLSMHNYISCRI